MGCPKCHENNAGVIEGTHSRTITNSNGKKYYEEETLYKCPCGCEFIHVERYELRYVCTIDRE